MMQIPLVDLKAQYLAHKDELDHAIRRVVEETAFIRGKYVADFEKAYAQAYGVKHCVSCGNGTDALYIVLKTLQLQPGDEIITTSNSWIASSESITQAGGRVVFCDVEPDYYNLDPLDVARKITPRTKAILAVHLMGQPAQLDALQDLCRKHNLFLLEDCAQAHFAEFKGKRVGTWGTAGTFSFYPGKNLGAYGDAGAIITNDDDLAAQVRMYANHGADRQNKHDHAIEGVNSRLDGLQASILLAKLPHIQEWTRLRNEKAKRYDKLLGDIPQIAAPKIRPEATHVYHIYNILAEDRDALQTHLTEKGIGTTRHYPTPLPFLKAYQYLNHKASDFPVVSRLQKQILSLPIYPELSEEQSVYVADTIRSFYSGKP